jgi:hypothetical protein
VGSAEQGSSAKFTRLELTECHAGNSVRSGVLYQQTLRSVRRSKRQVKIAAAIAAELESLLRLGDGCIGRRMTERTNIMTFACNYA